jgi:hypothetical protein
MLKSISNLGAVLNKTEQRTINGGQIKCPRGQILVCIWSGCWCQAEIDDRPDER